MISSHALDEIEKMTPDWYHRKGDCFIREPVETVQSQHSSNICLRTSADDMVAALLGLDVNQTQLTNQGILLHYADAQLAQVVKRLVLADVAVYRVFEVSKSLEELFHRLHPVMSCRGCYAETF